MRKAVKGLLLSGLVIPGLGQIVLKRYLRGTVFLLAAIGGLVAMLLEAIRIAMGILEGINANPELVDVNQITNLLDQASSPMLRAAMTVILLSWIISMVDAYLIGSRMDRQAAASATGSSEKAP